MKTAKAVKAAAATLLVGATFPGNPAAQAAMDHLGELRDCEMHMTHIVTPGDEAGMRRVGLLCTSDPFFASSDLFVDS